MSFHQVTGRETRLGPLEQRRLRPVARGERLRAARMEGATGRDVDEGRHETRIQLLSPGRGKTLMKTSPSSFSLDARSFADNVTLFNNLGFSEYGTHILQVYLDGFMVKELPLNVLKPPTASQPSPPSSTRVN